MVVNLGATSTPVGQQPTAVLKRRQLRLKAVALQGLLCQPEVEKFRLEEVASQTSYRVVVERACSKTTRWAIHIPSASRTAGL